MPKLTDRLLALDTEGVRRIRALPHARPVDWALLGLSRATDHSDGWLALSLAGAAVDRRRRAKWIDAGCRVAFVELESRALTRTLPRARPQLEGLCPLAPTPSPMSFPSSHTAAAVVAASAFRGLLPDALLRAIAALTAFSRLYLGVHFPSDVIAGVWLGRRVASPGRASERTLRRAEPIGGGAR
ncbi:MAG: phosphatase PAP2 family protein [Solirubrobacteraceae bacterium]